VLNLLGFNRLVLSSEESFGIIETPNHIFLPAPSTSQLAPQYRPLVRLLRVYAYGGAAEVSASPFLELPSAGLGE
jgi:hypothetical protein